MEYQIVLSDGGALTYGATSTFAANEADALQNAKLWTKSLDFVPEDAWLVLNAKGRGITCKPRTF